MQSYSSILSSEKLVDSRSKINDNFESLVSSFSGISFPTLNLSVGMVCYRTDLRKSYRLTASNPDVWTEIEDISHPFATLDYVNDKFINYATLSGATFTGNVSAPSFVGDLNGNAKTASKFEKAITIKLADGATSDGYIIDGSGNVTVAVKSLNSRYISGDISNNVTGTSARLGRSGNAAVPMTFNWSGQNGQPTWLWGGEDGTNMYIYNPSNFRVSHANSSAALDNWGGISSNFAGSNQGYRYIAGYSANVIDASGGSGALTRYLLRTHTGIGAGTYTLQQVLQELIYRCHSHDIYRENYDCNCSNCDCGA